MLKEKGVTIKLMISLEVDHNELVARLENRGKFSGRPDDQNLDIINNRISIYNETTRPVKEYYKSQEKFFGINGMGSIEDIFGRICNAIELVVAKEV
jgi:adenylate kinase